MDNTRTSHGLTVFLVCWAALSPLIGILVGHVLTRSWQIRQWRMDRRWQDYQAVMTAITSAYMAILRLDNAKATNSLTRELVAEVETIKHDSFRVIRDRIAIAGELENGNILVDWDTAVTNYEADTREERRFAERFSAINERLVRMARNPPPGTFKQLGRWLNWRAQYQLARFRKQV